MRLSYADADRLVRQALLRSGLSPEEVAAVADEILFAESRGRRSHGFNMLGSMADRAKKATGSICVIEDSENACLIDGGGRVGPYVARYAVDRAMEKARRSSLALAAVRNPSPFLTAGYSVWRAAREGFIAIATTVAKAKVAPYGSTKAILGTNPIAFGFPAHPHPVVIDMAVTKLPAADVELAKREGRALPSDVAYDPDGSLTTDPAAAQRGALIPFGGYKGSALGIMVELLAGAFVGAKCGLQHGEMRSMVFILICADALIPLQDVTATASDLCADIRASGDGVLVPGDRAEASYRRSMAQGFEISEELYAQLTAVAG